MRRGKLVLVGAVWLMAGCGAANDPKPPDDAPPTGSNTTPGGTVSGKYLLRLEAAPECAPPARILTFRMDARMDNSGPRPGIQATLEFNPYMEMELIYTAPNVQGNIGTDYNFVAPAEVPQLPVWIHAIVTGAVSSENGGPGEVLDGKMAGHVAFGDRNRTCFSNAHRWSLRIR
jgi:hypothetical protein